MQWIHTLSVLLVCGKTWKEAVQKGCQARKLKREGAVDCSRYYYYYYYRFTALLDFVWDYSGELLPER